ncbi:MAG: decaprenyl-phosphate phosphoribosyltransferase [Nitrospirota bacterium]|nr:decaprenyl-phosphate phosphoribosyltransferase [Nitrospirota bacterium]
MVLKEIFLTLRPRQWVKNVVIFAALIFSQNLIYFPLILRATLAFVIFCLLSGAVYIFNDLMDLEQDRLHPVKKNRPIASGRITPQTASLALLVLVAVAVGAAYRLGTPFFIAALTYLALFIFYTLKLKHVVILDLLTIAAGFVVRAVAGAVVISVDISHWLLLCTILLALFLGLAKRRHELVLLAEQASEHRKILAEYSPQLLDQMISVVTSSTVVTYALYTMSSETIEKFGTDNLVFTVPFVLYGIFRYLYLVHQKQEGGSPERLLFSDKYLLVNVVAWVLAIWLIIY